MSDLTGRVALVTGSSSGIGKAVAAALSGAGASVVVNSATSVEAGERVASELPGSTYVQGDISDAGQVAALVETAVERYGRLDILINNAGTTQVVPHHDLEAATDELWERILKVNVIGTFAMIRAAVPHLRATGAGCIVNITSLAGVRPTGSSVPYAVSKAALNHLTLLMANVLGPEIRVNAVAPGLIDTPWTEDWTALRSAVQSAAPLRRTGQPEDVAEACLGLVRSGYATGQILVVDGGMFLR